MTNAEEEGRRGMSRHQDRSCDLALASVSPRRVIPSRAQRRRRILIVGNDLLHPCDHHQCDDPCFVPPRQIWGSYSLGTSRRQSYRYFVVMFSYFDIPEMYWGDIPLIFGVLVCLELTFSTYLVQIFNSHGSLSAEAVSNEMCTIFIFMQLQPDARGLFTFKNEIIDAMLHSYGWAPENQPQYASIFIMAKGNSVPSWKVYIK